MGYWRTVKFSGAMPATRIKELLERIEKLSQAVKFAREEANNTEAEQQHISARMFQYLLG